MSKPERCIHDVQNGIGQSLARATLDQQTVIGVQESLLDIDGAHLPKNSRVLRSVIPALGEDPYPTDEAGNQIITIPEAVELPLEHHTIATSGSLVATETSDGAQPMDLLVVIGDPLAEVADATFSVVNTSDRMMQFLLFSGIHHEINYQTAEPNRIYSQTKIDIAGVVDGPLQLLNHKQTVSTADLGVIDEPSLGPSTRPFVLAPGAQADLRVALELRVAIWDGQSTLSNFLTRFALMGSTMEA